MNKYELICKKRIIEILNNYGIMESFKNTKEFNKWLKTLNELQIDNILSLNIDPNLIEFDPILLINGNLLNTTDYLRKVNAFVSIKNANGWYHLFNNMLTPSFLNSQKFYQDIEYLKMGESAQVPLWIIGKKAFIESPYHDEDFETLVTVKDTSEPRLDFVVREVIAELVENKDSIESGYHKIDMQTIIKYGSDHLQTPHSFPEYTIGKLAINKVSLNDRYHLENMEILVNNPEIANFLFAVMTDEETIKKIYYRDLIEEMIRNKNNKIYVFLLCYYAVGEIKTRHAQFLNDFDIYYDIDRKYNIEEVLKNIDDKINLGFIIDDFTIQLNSNKSKQRNRINSKKNNTITNN